MAKFDYMQKVSENFRAGEFLPPDAHEYTDDPLALISGWQIRVAEALRERFGATYINTWLFGGRLVGRGVRIPYGKTSNIGAAGSRHRFGLALDCSFKNKTAEQARKELKTSEFYFMEKGVARFENKVNWLHVDAGLRITSFNP